MATNEVEIKVTVDAEGATRLFNQLGEEIKVTTTAADRAEQSLTKTQASIITISSAANLAREGIALMNTAFNAFTGAIVRGSEVSDISEAFDNLATKAGIASDVLLNQLNTAFASTIPNLDLMKTSNELLLAGIAPDKIVQLGEAARALGEQTGVDAKEGMDRFTEAVLRGKTASVEKLGLIIDEKRELTEYIKANNIAADSVADLSEETRKMVLREAIYRELTKRADEFGEANIDAGDRVAQASKVMTDKFDEVYNAVASNAGVNSALDELISTIANVDAKQFAADLGTIAAEFIKLTSVAIEFAREGLGLVKEVMDSIAGRDSDFNAGLNQIFARITDPLGFRSSNAFTALDQQMQDLVANMSEVGDKGGAAIAKLRDQYNKLGNDIRTNPILFISDRNKLIADLNLVHSQLVTLTGVSGAFGASQTALGATLGVTAKKAGEANKPMAELNKTLGGGKKEIDELAKATGEYNKSLNKLLGKDSLPGVSEELKDVFYNLRQGNITAEQAESAINDLSRGYRHSAESIKAFESALGDASEAADDQTTELLELQAQMRELDQHMKSGASIEDYLTGNKKGEGKSLNDQLFEGIFGENAELADTIANTLSGAIADGIKNGFDREDIGITAAAVGKDFAHSFGITFLDPFIDLGGDFLNDAIESIFGGEHPGTTARKAADKFFADAFDANRLLVIIDGQLQQIEDLVFQGDTLFGGNSQFTDGSFANFFEGLPAAAQQAFSGVGLAFEELLGVSDDISGQIAAVLANNIGGSLNNLQLLVGATGKSFEELQGYVVEAFLDGKISALEAQSALQGLAQIAQKGIPDGIGFTVKAFENLKAAGEKGGRASIDALQDIAFEAKELGIRTFPELVANLAASGQFTAEEIQQVFDALATYGITSVDQLANATNEQLIPVLAQLQAQQFPFAEAANEASELINTLDKLPGEKSFTLNVKTNFDANTQTLAESGALNELNAITGPAGRGPSIP